MYYFVPRIDLVGRTFSSNKISEPLQINMSAYFFGQHDSCNKIIVPPRKFFKNNKRAIQILVYPEYILFILIQNKNSGYVRG